MSLAEHKAESTGTTPSGWRLVRLDQVAQVNPRRPRLSIDPEALVTFLPMAAVSEDCSGITTRAKRPYRELSKGYTYFEKNDILFAKITPCLQNGKHARATGLHNGFGFGTTEFHVLRARACIDPRHLFRVVTQAMNIEKFANSFTGTAGQQRIQPEVLKSLRFHLPPLAEQHAIAEVLDAVDDAIERTDEVISATEGLREALLHKLLTKGLPGRHTEWQEHHRLGIIPSDWRVRRLGEIAEWKSGGTPKVTEQRFYKNGTIPWVVISDLLRDPVSVTEKQITMDGLLKIGGRLAPVGSVLVSMYGTIGRVSMAGIPVATNQAIAWGEAKEDIVIGEYLRLIMQALQPYYEGLARGAAQRNINRQIIRSTKVPLPCLAEQQSIADTLDGVDGTIDQTRREKAGLATFKESISDALLTGRVRVPLRA